MHHAQSHNIHHVNNDDAILFQFQPFLHLHYNTCSHVLSRKEVYDSPSDNLFECYSQNIPWISTAIPLDIHFQPTRQTARPALMEKQSLWSSSIYSQNLVNLIRQSIELVVWNHRYWQCMPLEDSTVHDANVFHHHCHCKVCTGDSCISTIPMEWMKNIPVDGYFLSNYLQCILYYLCNGQIGIHQCTSYGPFTQANASKIQHPKSGSPSSQSSHRLNCEAPLSPSEYWMFLHSLLPCVWINS